MWENTFISRETEDEMVTIIKRDASYITIGSYLTETGEYALQATIRMWKESGSWQRLHASSLERNVEYEDIARLIVEDMLYNKRWESHRMNRPGKKRLHVIEMRTHIDRHDPHWLYNERSATICTFCKTSKPKYLCAKCQWTRYCSKDCQTKDWNVHRSICMAAKKKQNWVQSVAWSVFQSTQSKLEPSIGPTYVEEELD